MCSPWFTKLIRSPRKKKKSKSKQETELEAERSLARELNLKEDPHSPTPVGSGQSTPAVVNNSNSKKTDAEKRFEEAQKRRVRTAFL
jgi:protein FAM32A